MKSAWVQIEKQLDESPLPSVVAEQILNKVIGQKSGRFYGGGFFFRMNCSISRTFIF